MTQWYKPRQFGPGATYAGKWHYTCGNTSGTSVYPVGGCAHDCPGHDSAEGAARHYAEWLSAAEIREREDQDARHKCEVCEEWTQHRAMLWGDAFGREHAICATHDIRAHLRSATFKKYDIKEDAVVK